MTQNGTSASRQAVEERHPAGAGTPPPGASEPTPKQPKTPPPAEPEASDPQAQGGTKNLPEGKYGTADIMDKPKS